MASAGHPDSYRDQIAIGTGRASGLAGRSIAVVVSPDQQHTSFSKTFLAMQKVSKTERDRLSLQARTPAMA